MPLTGSTVLVTGGAGFIGSHLVKELVASGNRVRIIDDLSSGKLDNIADVKAEFVEGSVLDAGLVDELVRGSAYVFHLAAIPSITRSIMEPVPVLRVNMEGTMNVIAAALHHDSKLIFSSSSAVYGEVRGPNTESMPLDPISPYGVHKASAEQLIRSYTSRGLRALCLRYFNVFGPGQDPASDYAAVVPSFLECISKGKHITIFGDGHQSRDMCYVGNVVEANILASTSDRKDGRAFNIATGRSVEVSELVKILFKVTERTVEVRHTAPRPGDIMHSAADITRAREELGFEPSIGLEEGLKMTWERMQEPEQ